MRLDDFRVAVLAGEGVVARFPAALLVVASGAAACPQVVDRLIAECQQATGEARTARWRELVASAAESRLPAFSAVVDSGDGLAVFVHGPSHVSISGGQPVVALGDQGLASWGARISDRVGSLLVGVTEPAAVAPWLDLRSGVVSGAGAVLVPLDAATTEADFVESPGEVVPGRRSPAETWPREPPGGPAPAPSPPGTPEPGAAGQVMVWGVNCKQGHFNDPDARYCRTCGTHMAHQRRDLVLGPRPVVGYLVADGGVTYKLDADYLIGRDPSLGQTANGDARRMVLSDADGTVSATHASIRLHEWNVVVTDQGSYYGTHVWMPGSKEWVRLEGGQSLRLDPSHILLGRRQLVFQPVNRR